jgi:hypothetical protein
MSRRLNRVRRVNAKRPPTPKVEIYPLPANDYAAEAIIDYITMLLDERDALRKG